MMHVSGLGLDRPYLGSLGMHIGWWEISKTEIIIFNKLNTVSCHNRYNIYLDI